MNSNGEKMIDVCISCVAADRIRAEGLAEYLRSCGMDCKAGHSYAGAAKVMVLLFSDAAHDSVALINDINSALAVGATIIPYRLTDKEPSGTMGFYLKPLQWLDAFGKDENASKAALAELCAASLSGSKATGGSAGPEMALLRRKAAKRKRIALIAAAAVLVLVIGAAILLNRDKGQELKPVRDMSCAEFFDAYRNNLDNKYSDTGHVYMKSTDGEIKYGVKLSKEADPVVIVRFFDTYDGDPESEDAGFSKIGITNSTAQEQIDTPEEWEPYIKAFLATLYPEYSDQEIDDLLAQLYDTNTGSKRIIGGTYQLDYTYVGGLYLLEVKVK